MHIDWFTFIAQIINFLILVFLLKHFLYGPIIKAMDKREENIAKRLQDAENREQEAKNQIDTYQKKNEEIDNARNDMLSKAKEDAEKKHQELIDNARSEVDQLANEWKESIQKEENAFINDLKIKIGEQVIAISRRSIEDLANANLEKEIILKFIDIIIKLQSEDLNNIKKSISESENKAIIQSTFDIDDETKQTITKAIKEQFSDKAEIDFEKSDDLICGITLKTTGYKIGWNINNYLQNINEKLSETLKTKIA